MHHKRLAKHKFKAIFSRNIRNHTAIKYAYHPFAIALPSKCIRFENFSLPNFNNITIKFFKSQ